MFKFYFMNKLPNICPVFLCQGRHICSSFPLYKKRSSKRKRKYTNDFTLLSCLNSSMNDLNSKLLYFGFNNNIESLICLLQECIMEGSKPQLPTLHLVANSLCDAQSKEGIVLASFIAHQHFSRYYSSMCNFEVFQPVEWNHGTLNRSLSHFEMLYIKSQPPYVGKAFRSSLISSYLSKSMRMEFLDLYYFVSDVFYFWKDVQPLTAFWEVLFCSPQEEDQVHALNLLKQHKKKIMRGMNTCLLSFVITLANIGDTESLVRLAELIENKTVYCGRAGQLYPSLKQLIIEMKYNEGRLDESILLMASDNCSRRPVKRVLKWEDNDFNVDTPNKKWNPKLHFVEIMTVEEAMMIPISPVKSPKP